MAYETIVTVIPLQQARDVCYTKYGHNLATFNSFSESATKKALSSHEKAVLYSVQGITSLLVFSKDIIKRFRVPSQLNQKNGCYRPVVERVR